MVLFYPKPIVVFGVIIAAVLYTASKKWRK